MEASVPGTSSTTGSTERDPGNAVATAASRVARRSPRPRARRTTGSSIAEHRFDAVVALRVEGVSLSAVARVEGIAWNTVARWLEHAAAVCRGFNQSRMAGFVVEELQADEIRSFVGGKTRPTWIFVAIEVWSRLWPSTVTGRRSYRNTLALVRDIVNRMEVERLPLIVTDGFEFYEKVVRRIFGPAVLYGQVLKTRRHDRIVQVERRARMGAPWRFDAALTNSEDSSTLNTSFIERLNLTIRQGLAYLSRRTLSHARSADKLDGHLELLRCHYNFVRPHGALTFGREVRTPAMQAGLAARLLTFREVFVCPPPSFLLFVSIGAISCAVPSRLPTTPVGGELLAA